MKDKNHNRITLLVKLRRQREQAIRQALASAQERSRQVQAEQDAIQAQLMDENHLARLTLLASSGPAELASYRAAIGEIRRSLAGSSERLAKAREELALRQGQMVAAMRQRKVADSLRQRLAAQQEAQQARQEVKAGDDLHASRSLAAANQNNEGTAP
ncbi:MAG: hypothetical protein WC869_10975 [Phycisphaerae bacterium]|jgi:hypothetical protein